MIFGSRGAASQDTNYSQSRFTYRQCDQIGRISKALSNKFSYKSSPNTLHLFKAALKTTLFKKKCWDYFLGKIWATFYSNIWPHCLPPHRPQPREFFHLRFRSNLIIQFDCFDLFGDDIETTIFVHSFCRDSFTIKLWWYYIAQYWIATMTRHILKSFALLICIASSTRAGAHWSYKFGNGKNYFQLFILLVLG